MPDYRAEVRDADGNWRPIGSITDVHFTTDTDARITTEPPPADWSRTVALASAERSARRFTDSMRKLAETARQGARNIRLLGRTLTMPITGPRNLDPADDTWQTDLCAAWLCGSCPSPAYCDCTCHGGTRL